MTGERRADALVLFGATGDLARKKIFPALYWMAADGRLDVPVVGVAASPWDDTRLRRYAETAIRAESGTIDPSVLGALSDRLRYVSGDYRDPAT
jgi:glucose-6-phosphate 1-dehydrogenase